MRDPTEIPEVLSILTLVPEPPPVKVAIPQFAKPINLDGTMEFDGMPDISNVWSSMIRVTAHPSGK
jgi:hypothetical protein